MIRYKFRTQEPQHWLSHEIQRSYPTCARREMGTFFYILARFRILSSPLHSSLPFLMAVYNPSHKLLTMNEFSFKKLGFTPCKADQSPQDMEL